MVDSDYVNEKRLEKGWYIERCGDVYPLFSEKMGMRLRKILG